MRVHVRSSYSTWEQVISGVPQGSVLGPLLFLIYINDLPDSIYSCLRMFADDTKIWSVIRLPSDSDKLQSDLDRLMDWTQQWLLAFNVDKCKVMHIGSKSNSEYFLTDRSGRKKLEETTMEKDLGVYVTSDMKSSTQCGKAASKASSVLAMVKRNFKHVDVDSFQILFKTYIRPHLEYCRLSKVGRQVW